MKAPCHGPDKGCCDNSRPRVRILTSTSSKQTRRHLSWDTLKESCDQRKQAGMSCGPSAPSPAPAPPFPLLLSYPYPFPLPLLVTLPYHSPPLPSSPLIPLVPYPHTSSPLLPLLLPFPIASLTPPHPSFYPHPYLPILIPCPPLPVPTFFYVSLARQLHPH